MSAPGRPTGFAPLLPPIDSKGYHLLLEAWRFSSSARWGHLGGVHEFSIGFFHRGQVLAGILGSTITLGYGPEGKHGANYMQTMARQSPACAAWRCSSRRATGSACPTCRPAAHPLLHLHRHVRRRLGMVYTPLLVDRMQLAYPSGLAVANILRALTDKNLLKKSVAKLGGGIRSVTSAAWLAEVHGRRRPRSFHLHLGAGMIVGARIALPALVVASSATG